jgi:AcrR family transcriptional regulator
VVTGGPRWIIVGFRWSAMSRPPNANAERTKRKILLSASRKFADRGFEATSMRQVAAGAGVSLGMIQHYFGSKQGLYRACIASAYEIYPQLTEQINFGLDLGKDPAEVVSLAVRTGFRYAVDNRPAFRLTLWKLTEGETWRSDLGDAHMLPFVLDTARAIANVLDVSASDAAMRIRSIIFLVVRLATADHNEIAYLLSDGNSRARATRRTLQEIEDHLAQVALKLFS